MDNSKVSKNFIIPALAGVLGIGYVIGLQTEQIEHKKNIEDIRAIYDMRIKGMYMEVLAKQAIDDYMAGRRDLLKEDREIFEELDKTKKLEPARVYLSKRFRIGFDSLSQDSYFQIQTRAKKPLLSEYRVEQTLKEDIFIKK